MSASSSPTQLWKVNDERAQKNGACQAVYWVKQAQTSFSSSSSSSSSSASKRYTSKTTRLNNSSGVKEDKKWATGTVYKGEWADNRKHGYGIQLWSSGNKYEGMWEQGKRHGQGTLWLKNKAAVKGEKRIAAAPSSTSSSHSSSSSPSQSSCSNTDSINRPSSSLHRVYAGNWSCDVKSGSGIYYYIDGSYYDGNWSADERCGNGTLYYSNGDRYIGEWKHNQQNGVGTLTRKNNDMYEGEWLNGKREGAGIYYYKSKEKIYDGEWVADQPKCGVYCDAKEFFSKQQHQLAHTAAHTASTSGVEKEENAIGTTAAAVAEPKELPPLRLLSPDSILSTRIESIQIQRAAIRQLPYVDISRLFTTAAMEQLKEVFDEEEKKQVEEKQKKEDERKRSVAGIGIGVGIIPSSPIHFTGHLPVSSLRSLLQSACKPIPSVKAVEVDEILIDIGKYSLYEAEMVAKAAVVAAASIPAKIASTAMIDTDDMRVVTGRNSRVSSKSEIDFIEFVKCAHLLEEKRVAIQLLQQAASGGSNSGGVVGGGHIHQRGGGKEVAEEKEDGEQSTFAVGNGVELHAYDAHTRGLFDGAVAEGNEEEEEDDEEDEEGDLFGDEQVNLSVQQNDEQ